jgi:hypothetical protein
MTVGALARDAATAEFLDGTATGQFLLRHCRDCGILSAPQAQQCERCGSTDLDWRPASGNAVLVSWTVAHGKPSSGGAPAQTVLVIGQLAEGPWWWSQLIGAQPAELYAGASLRIAFERNSAEHAAVPIFRLHI